MNKNDFLDEALTHSWGTTPRQKAAEKAYNAKYYKEHKDKWQQRYYDLRDRRQGLYGRQGWLKDVRDRSKSETRNIVRNAKRLGRPLTENDPQFEALGYYNKQVKYANQARPAAAKAMNEAAKSEAQAAKMASQYDDKATKAYSEERFYEKLDNIVSSVNFQVNNAKELAKKGYDYVANLLKK